MRVAEEVGVEIVGEGVDGGLGRGCAACVVEVDCKLEGGIFSSSDLSEGNGVWGLLLFLFFLAVNSPSFFFLDTI